MTKEMLDDLRSKQKCSFYKTKVKKHQAVLIPPHTIASFNQIKPDVTRAVSFYIQLEASQK